MLSAWVEMLLVALVSFLGSQLPNQEGGDPFPTISSGPSSPPAIKYPTSAEYISAHQFLFPSAMEAPPTTNKTAQMYRDAFAVLLKYETSPPVAPTESAATAATATESVAAVFPAAIEVAATPTPIKSTATRANPPATANPPEPEDDDVEAQSSRLQWFADFLFGVMIILLAIFMTRGESTSVLGFLFINHRQVFVAKGQKNQDLRSTIAALQANPVLFALPPPTDDEDLDETAQYASGSTQTEAVTYSSAGTQTGATDSVSVGSQTDAVNYQSVGTQTIPDALPTVDHDEVAELRAVLAKQRQDSDLIIRNLQASLGRLGAENGQLRAQLLQTSRPTFASPPSGVGPNHAGLAYDPHHNPNPLSNAQQLARNAALQQQQQRQYQSPQQPHWQQPQQGWQGYRQ